MPPPEHSGSVEPRSSESRFHSSPSYTLTDYQIVLTVSLSQNLFPPATSSSVSPTSSSLLIALVSRSTTSFAPPTSCFRTLNVFVRTLER